MVFGLFVPAEAALSSRSQSSHSQLQLNRSEVLHDWIWALHDFQKGNFQRSDRYSIASSTATHRVATRLLAPPLDWIPSFDIGSQTLKRPPDMPRKSTNFVDTPLSHMPLALRCPPLTRLLTFSVGAVYDRPRSCWEVSNGVAEIENWNLLSGLHSAAGLRSDLDAKHYGRSPEFDRKR